MEPLPSLYTTTRLKRIVALRPDKLDSEYKNHIRDQLKEYEGKCNPEGFIEKDSIQEIENGPMMTEADRFRGYLRVEVTFRANVCYPVKGDLLRCQVKNVNPFGVMAMTGPLNIVAIPPEGVKVSPGEMITIKVVSVDFNQNETHIDVYGKFPEEEKEELEEEEEQVGVGGVDDKKEEHAEEEEEEELEDEESLEEEEDEEEEDEEEEEEEFEIGMKKEDVEEEEEEEAEAAEAEEEAEEEVEEEAEAEEEEEEEELEED